MRNILDYGFNNIDLEKVKKDKMGKTETSNNKERFELKGDISDFMSQGKNFKNSYKTLLERGRSIYLNTPKIVYIR